MTFSRSSRDQELLVDYVRQALARIDAGEAVDPTQLCKTDPHLARPLAEVLGLAEDLSGLQAEALREDPLAGLVLANRYRLEDCLGRGAMGVVYRAEDQELQRSIAVKILDVRLFRDDRAEQRFQREAEALAALQHDSVVTVHDRGHTSEGIHFLVMELLEGATLSAILEAVDEGGDPIAAAEQAIGGKVAATHWSRLCAGWMAAVASGLSAAHERGLVHRDVKPSNIFVRRSGAPVLLDFGIAAQGSAERLTATETSIGTPWYMAPEQVGAGGVVTAQPTLDVYGMGATFYHLLAGKPPYEGEAVAVLAALVTEDPVPLQRAQPETPRDLVAIVEHCLERKPTQRYATAAVLCDDLDAFLGHQPVSVRPLSPLGRRLRAWRRAPARPVAVLAVALAVIVLAIWLPTHFEQQRVAMQRQKDALYATLPSVLAIEGWPQERGLEALHDEHREAIALLDSILALDAGDLPIRLFRAALRFDLGDREGAAADLEWIAEYQGGDYLQQLAARYLLVDDKTLGTVDTDGLPDPVTAQECYVAGFHELRARERRGYANRATELLDRAVPDYPPARDLRLLSVAALAEASAGDYREQLVDFLYDETVKLEELYGVETARTQAMRGVALMMQKKYREAAACFERSIELRPRRHGPHQNLGIAYMRLGDLELSRQHLQTALGLRPFAWNTKYAFAQLEEQCREFDAAYDWAAQMPLEGSGVRSWMRPYLIGNIATTEAIVLRHDDPNASRDAASRAVAAFDRALLQAPKSPRLARHRQLALALDADSLRADAMVDYVGFLMSGKMDKSSDAYSLRNLAFLMPAELGPREAAWLAAFLRWLAAGRAGGNENLRAELEADIEELLRPFR